MEQELYKEEDKIPVSEYCKNYIQINGYVRLGYCIKMAVPNKIFQNDSHRRAFINSVSSSLINTGRYIREACHEVEGDYDIRLNPDYIKKGFWQRHPFYEKLVIAIVSGGISLMVGLTITKQSKQSQSLIDKQQDSLIKAVSDSITKIQKNFNK